MIVDLKKYQKPKVNIRVKYNERFLWGIFAPHHYMTQDKSDDKSLPNGASFYTFYIFDEGVETLVACLGVIPQISKIPARRITRFVILPEFQGMGLSGGILDSIADMYHKDGIKMYIATFHNRLGNFLENSTNWAPSVNNRKETITTSRNDNFFDSSYQSGLRHGVAMYRYNYQPVKTGQYKFIYNPLVVINLKRLLKTLSGKEAQDVRAEIKQAEEKIQKQQEKIYGEEKNRIYEHETEENKNNLKRVLKKPKRKVLTKEQREQRKKEINAQNSDPS